MSDVFSYVSDASQKRNEPASNNTLVPRWAVVLLSILLVAVSVQYTFKSSEDRSAFNRWKSQLHGLANGENIYELYIYPNAPMMALILYPLSLLPEVPLFGLDVDLGAQCWFFLKVAITMLAFLWTFKLVEDAARPFPSWAKLLTILLSIRPIIGDLSHGNVNLLILFLVIASLYAYCRGRDIVSGLTLALAITCKVTPALFVPYLLWKRAWKTLAGCAIGLVLFFFVIPSTFLGPAHNWKLLNSWVDCMILPYAKGTEITTEHHNQSLNGLFYRVLTYSPSFEDKPDAPGKYYNVVDWDMSAARWLLKGCGIAFLILMLWTCRTPTRPRQQWRLAAEFSVVILGMLLFSERTWKHHCVTLLLPFAVLSYYLAMDDHSRASRLLVVSGICAATLLMTTTSTTLWEPFGYRIGAKLAQVYGAYVWAEIVLLAVLLIMLRSSYGGYQYSTRVPLATDNAMCPGINKIASCYPSPLTANRAACRQTLL